jgi:hypothetical protein
VRVDVVGNILERTKGGGGRGGRRRRRKEESEVNEKRRMKKGKRRKRNLENGFGFFPNFVKQIDAIETLFKSNTVLELEQRNDVFSDFASCRCGQRHHRDRRKSAKQDEGMRNQNQGKTVGRQNEPLFENGEVEIIRSEIVAP